MKKKLRVEISPGENLSAWPKVYDAETGEPFGVRSLEIKWVVGEAPVMKAETFRFGASIVGDFEMVFIDPRETGGCCQGGKNSTCEAKS
jgi:hypothetical protein